jgi:[ribosomal protein S5]-alanine N-acetyltransferase
MPKIKLIPVTLELLNKLILSSVNAIEDNVIAETERELIKQVAGQTKEFMEKNSIPQQWGSFLAADIDQKIIIGTCSFKGAPDSNGVVEIAYYTFPSYERQGYATSMAQMLIDIATSSSSVKDVIALTLAEKNPSTSVLKKVGMRFAGEYNDPEDGLVWRWIYDRNLKG